MFDSIYKQLQITRHALDHMLDQCTLLRLNYNFNCQENPNLLTQPLTNMTVFMTDLWWASLMTWGFECKSLALHRGSPWEDRNKRGSEVINTCHTNLHFQLNTSGTTTRGSRFCTLTTMAWIQPTLPRAFLTNKLTPCASNSVASPPSKISGASSLMHCFRHAEEAMGTLQVSDGKWANTFLESHSRKQRCSGDIKRCALSLETVPVELNFNAAPAAVENKVWNNILYLFVDLTPCVLLFRGQTRPSSWWHRWRAQYAKLLRIRASRTHGEFFLSLLRHLYKAK